MSASIDDYTMAGDVGVYFVDDPSVFICKYFTFLTRRCSLG